MLREITPLTSISVYLSLWEMSPKYLHLKQTKINKDVHLGRCPLFPLLLTFISSFPPLPATGAATPAPSSPCSWFHPLPSLTLCHLVLKAEVFFFFKQGHLMKIHIKVECSCQFTTTVRFINHCVMRSLRISVSSALISRIRTNEHLSCDVCFIQGWGTGKDNCVLLVFFWGTHRQFDWSYLGSKILFFLALEWGWHPLLISLCGIKIHEDQYRIVIGNVTSYILIMLLVIEIE